MRLAKKVTDNNPLRHLKSNHSGPGYFEPSGKKTTHSPRSCRRPAAPSGENMSFVRDIFASDDGQQPSVAAWRAADLRSLGGISDACH